MLCREEGLKKTSIASVWSVPLYTSFDFTHFILIAHMTPSAIWQVVCGRSADTK